MIFLDVTPIAAAAGLLIGLTLGMLGGGGSILTVPAFVYIIGFSPKLAIAMSLAVVGTTSLFAAVGHLKRGNLELHTAIPFGIVTMAGAYVGAHLSVFVSGTTQLVMLSLVMLASAVSMLRSSRRDAKQGAVSTSVVASPRPFWQLGIVGFCVGILTGLVGIGGGFLIVPALVVLGSVEMRKAVGTSLLIMAATTTTGYLGYTGKFDIPWGFLVVFTVLTISGSMVGVALSSRVPVSSLKKGFALMLIVVGALILYQNLTATTALTS